MLEHGGRLLAAARRYGIPPADWLDLSAALNPQPYPVPPLPAAVWQRLPEDEDGLSKIAAGYYGSDQLLPVAGTQPALMHLPALLPGKRIGLLAPSYREHAQAWQAHPLVTIEHAPGDALEAARAIDRQIDQFDVLLLVHPNNPSGLALPLEILRAWRARLMRRGGWLIVDEAFIDCTPALSLAPQTGEDGLVVLRSLGKFFGLAGARAGFVFAPEALRTALAERLGPWAVSGPARHAARHALADRTWQETARRRLAHDRQRLGDLLDRYGLTPSFGPALFAYHPCVRAAALHEALARRGILTRLFDDAPALRFGLPGDEAGWQRLDRSLAAVTSAFPTP